MSATAEKLAAENREYFSMRDKVGRMKVVFTILRMR